MRKNKRQGEDITGEMSWSAPVSQGRRRPHAREKSRHGQPQRRSVDLTPEEERVVVQGLRHVLIGGYNKTAAELLQRLMGVG